MSVLDGVLASLTTVSSLELTGLLLEWRRDYSNGSYLLLQAIAAFELAGRVAESFARRLSCWDDDPDFVDAILAAGIERFRSPVRDWIVERPGVRARLSTDTGDEQTLEWLRAVEP
ncbi:hypothetical protein [Haliangium sp.]|uniref:hypothetical protein n=1 Tax=Haliangium sp. TaxID=2663208 RepID=UPI003D0FD4E1